MRGTRLFRFVELKEPMRYMNFFKRDNAPKKWHKRAWTVNPNKTKIIFTPDAGPKEKHVPPWIYKREQAYLDN